MTGFLRGAAVAACLLSLGLLAGCDRRPTGAATIVFACDALGRIENCDCPVEPKGGLPVLVARLAELRSERGDSLLVLEGGNLVAPDSGEEGVRAAAFLAAELEAAGCAALCLGPNEMALGDSLRSVLLHSSGLPWLGGWREAQRLEGATDTLILRAGGLRIGVARWADRDWLPAGPASDNAVGLPLEALRHLRGRCDAVVLVARTSPRDPEPLARQVEGLVDLLFVEATRKAWPEPRRFGTVAVLASGDRGRWLSRADLRVEKGRLVSVEGGAIELDSRRRGDEGARLRLAEHLAREDALRRERLEGLRLREIDELGLDPASLRSPEPGEFAGQRACAGCHEEIWASWRASEHGRAFGRLLAEGRSGDRLAQRVHVTGWLRPGGWLSLEETPELADVQCEACHGPGGAHAAREADVSGFRDPRESCVECHGARRFSEAELRSGSHAMPSPR